jgi:hypothetical protein
MKVSHLPRQAVALYLCVSGLIEHEDDVDGSVNAAQLATLRGLRFQEYVCTQLTEQLVGCDILEV